MLSWWQTLKIEVVISEYESQDAAVLKYHLFLFLLSGYISIWLTAAHIPSPYHATITHFSFVTTVCVAQLDVISDSVFLWNNVYLKLYVSFKIFILCIVHKLYAGIGNQPRLNDFRR